MLDLLVDSVLNDTNDEGRLLVLADWYDDNGLPQGQWIRFWLGPLKEAVLKGFRRRPLEENDRQLFVGTTPPFRRSLVLALDILWRFAPAVGSSTLNSAAMLHKKIEHRCQVLNAIGIMTPQVLAHLPLGPRKWYWTAGDIVSGSKEPYRSDFLGYVGLAVTVSCVSPYLFSNYENDLRRITDARRSVGKYLRIANKEAVCLQQVMQLQQLPDPAPPLDSLLSQNDASAAVAEGA